MYSKFVKFCSVILTVALLINLLPMQVLGADFQALLTQPENVSSNIVHDDTTLTQADNATIIGEVVDNRTEFSKEYQLSNGLYMTAIYPRAVHFKNNGKWDEIDNTLKVVGSDTNAAYTNTAGSWDVLFPQTLTGAKTVSVSKDGYSLSFGMAGELRFSDSPVIRSGEVANTTATLATDETYAITAARNSTAQIYHAKNALPLENFAHADTINQKADARISYHNVYSNTNVVYDLLSNQLKESIVIASFSNTLRGYRYTLNTGVLIPVLNDDNSIDLYDANKNSIIFTMPAPFMVDNAGEFCSDVGVTLTGSNGAYMLTYLLPVSWLAEDDRSWPVVLDPVITEHSSQSNIEDRTVMELQVPSSTVGVLELGWRQYRGNMRFFMKFNEIPALTSADVVVHAEIGLYKAQTSNTTVPVTVHNVLGNWSEEEITWSNKPPFDTTVEDYYLSKTQGMHYWDVTDIVRGWYETGNNYGMMFKVVDEYENLTSNNFRQYYSPDYSAHPSDFALYPGLWVTFRNNNGIESYWDYTSSSAGRAGTGYVNNYSGNLTWIRNDIGFDGNRMPVSISHVYNTNDIGDNLFGLGYGWRTNYNQTVGEWDKDERYYYWEDGDGTTHYFLWSDADNAYLDEDGLELTLTVSGSEVTITDKNGNKSFFDAQGRLYKMENNQATKSNITITYDSTSKLITRITDGAGRKYNFTYTDDLLSKISYTGKGDTELSYVTFGYSGSNLTSITDKDGKRSNFTYDANNLLETVQDVDNANNLLPTAQDVEGYKLTYTYSSSSPKRVVRIDESDGEVAGGYMTIEYAHNQTTLTDHSNHIEILQFNDWGNVISVQDTKGRAQFTQYARNKYNENDSSKANQLQLSSNLQDTAESDIWLIDSFENPPVWPYYGDSMHAELSTAEAYDGTYSTKLENTDELAWGEMAFDTLLLLPGETVKFSSYVKVIEGYANLAVELTAHAPAVSAVESSNSPVWEKLEVTYTNTTSIPEELYCSYYFWDSAVVYVDQALIEIFREDNRQNLLQNGDFRDNTAWSSLGGITTKYSRAPHTDPNVYRMTGNPSFPQSISQTVQISGVAGDCYILGGWAQGHSAPLRDNRKFGMRLTFNYTDGQTSSEYVSFNADYHSTKYWQYAAQPAVAKGAYSSITVEILYDYNANTVYFDGIQLFKENFGTSYTYDDEGNVVSVIDLQNQETEYIYDDTTKNLIGIDLPNGENVTYTYDDYHNVLTAKSVIERTDAEGQTVEEVIEVYTFTYDTYGNNISVSVGEGTARMTASATYSNEGNTLASATDAAGKVTTYQYNADTNVLEWVKYPNDTDATKTTYTYDSMYRLDASALTTNTNLNLSAEYTYVDDLLTSIATDSTTYSFGYGDFAQRSSVQIGNRNLATYTYTNDKNRYLSRLAYGNGDSVQYQYDWYGRVTKETYEDGSTVSYYYDNSGDLNYVEDSASWRSTSYYHDFLGRTMKYVESEDLLTHSVQYHYDADNLLTSTVEYIEYMYVPMEYTTAYTYDDLDRIKTVTANGITRTYTYDSYGRITRIEDTQGETNLQTIVYTYHDTAERISAQIATMRTTRGAAMDVTYSYTYDNNGNILTVSDGTNTTSYVYDSANQLIRENNQAAGKTWTWTYDSAGNILSKNEYAYTTGDLGTPIDTIPYTYNDADWGDLLTAYDGTAITYDTIGNPLNDGTWTYTWQNGRELATMSDGTVTWRYTYDANGMRTRRSGNNVPHGYEYIYNGGSLSQVIVDQWQTLKFTYDANGIPMMVNYENEDYYYITNLQGDVVGIADSTGALVVSYTYDAWGKPLSITGPMADTLGVQNPLRYRGYVYDQETGLYYVSSRYYDPEIGRWINADNQIAGVGGEFLGYNMFAYCMNNPVNMSDPSGNWPRWATIALGAIVAVAAVAVTVATLGAAAPAAACTLTAVGMSVGASYAVASTAATVAVVATTVAAAAYAGDIAYSAVTGDSLLLDTVFQGNTDAYNAGLAITSIATAGMLEAAAQSPGVCFVAGTPVLAVCGYIAIEEIKAGDMVWAENPETGEKGLKKVVQTFVNETSELIYVQVGSDEIVTTPEHPFYSPVKGWTAAGKLRAGDVLVLQNGKYVTVEKVQHEILETPITVYNFEVADFHTYYVGKSAVLVHNTCGKSSSRGVGGKGWVGDKTWRENVSTVGNGGTITSLNGGVPTQAQAMQLINQSGGTVLRIEGAHLFPNPHTYEHINYVTSAGIKGTIKIFG